MSERRTQRAELKIEVGTYAPLGATVHDGGVNFALYSAQATRMRLRLYRSATDAEPLMVIELDARRHRTYDFWHVYVVGARPGWCYTWSADGPAEPKPGVRFEPRRELLDPWARLVSDALWDREAAVGGGLDTALRAEIPAVDAYDWEGDAPLGRPLAESIIYELHVGGFTRHPSAGVPRPGTFRGVIDKIPYL